MSEITTDACLDPRTLTPAEFKAAAQQVRKTFYWEKKDLATYVTLTGIYWRRPSKTLRPEANTLLRLVSES